jgi:putative ABC transport system ATP-binding protein
MKSRVIQDEPEPTDLIDAPAATGASHGDKELKMEGIAMPAAQADGHPLADTANGSVVAAEKLSRRYGEGETAVDALRGVSLQVAPGKLTAVMGPSGSGKSTLMHILAGLDQPTSGEVRIAGTRIGKLNDTDLTKLRREHIGFIFQFFNLLPMLSAEENVVLPLSLAGEKLDRKWVDELMKRIGLAERSSHRPSELSGGQQQRVAIGRALVSKPTIVFADEPTGNLDSKTGGEILDLMRNSVDTYGQTTVMVTHDPRAAAIADRILFLADGVIVRDLGRTEAHEVIAVTEELAR